MSQIPDLASLAAVVAAGLLPREPLSDTAGEAGDRFPPDPELAVAAMAEGIEVGVADVFGVGRSENLILEFTIFREIAGCCCCCCC